MMNELAEVVRSDDDVFMRFESRIFIILGMQRDTTKRWLGGVGGLDYNCGITSYEALV